MAESNSGSGEGHVAVDRLRHAFGLLASAASGEWPAWAARLDAVHLRSRVDVLAELLGVVPSAGMRHLVEIVDAWCIAFPVSNGATVDQLRGVARSVLQPVTADRPPATSRETGLSRALALIAPPALLEFPGQHADGKADEAEAYRRCADGLGVWFDQLDSDRWTRLPACVPGENAVGIEKVYVELYATADVGNTTGPVTPEGPGRLARLPLSSQYPVVDIPTMLARTLQRCVVIGEPGAGKSTLVRWVVWAVHRGKCSDFRAALVVRLGAYAQALAEKPETSLVEFFFRSLGTRIDDWRAAADVLRRTAAENQRFLLLLDGWDEVPPGQREDVRERIAAERDHFVTVITSRASGLPQQFRDGDRVDVYQIAGLSNAARDELVRKLVTRRRTFWRRCSTVSG